MGRMCRWVGWGGERGGWVGLWGGWVGVPVEGGNRTIGKGLEGVVGLAVLAVLLGMNKFLMAFVYFPRRQPSVHKSDYSNFVAKFNMRLLQYPLQT